MMFSVIVPCYNRADTIWATLDSVRAQTFVDFECIVVDDGSADGEALSAVVRGMNDSRFRYLRRENGGGGAARNTGIAAANGSFIAFLDSDDLFLPEKLAVFSKVVSDDPLRAWYAPTYVDRGGDKRWIRPDRGIRLNEDMGEYLFVFNQFIQTSTIVVSTRLARELQFDPSLRKGQDLDLCVRWAAAGVRFEMLPQPQTVWVDVSEASRTSRHRGWEAPSRWLEHSRPLLTERAYVGYRATVLAYYLAAEKPILAFRHLLNGWLSAKIPFRIVARQVARCYVPRDLYRKLVNLFVALRGS